MIGICPRCGNYDWDKVVMGNQARCPKCGETWQFKTMPLFILTGCSGMGKTTTGIEIMKQQHDFVVLDADMFHSIMPHDTQEDYFNQIEQVESLSKNIMQSGRTVLWTMAGNLDKLNHAYNRRFIGEIHCLALVCEEAELRRRMTEGRKIIDEGWIQSSVEYNHYFQTHDCLADMPFDVFDTTGKSVPEVAEYVIGWIKNKLNI